MTGDQRLHGGVLYIPEGALPPEEVSPEEFASRMEATLPGVQVVIGDPPRAGEAIPDGTWQLLVTPDSPIARVVRQLVVQGLELQPIPVVGPDGQPTLDPEHWPGNDLPTYALKPA